MANKAQLPWDLTEEILSRVPPKSLVRFRIVSKQWNGLFNDKTFINNHKATFRFILTTKSKIYSVSINPKIDVRELTLDFSGLESQIPKTLIDCNGFLLCGMGKGAMVWNPWLRQTRWIEPEVNQTSVHFDGIGYDKDRGYKTLASFGTALDPNNTVWKTHDFSSDSWKDYEPGAGDTQKTIRASFLRSNGVSLGGAWYRVGYYSDKPNSSLFFLVNFNFSMGLFYKFCDLPCGGNRHHDVLALRVFMGDRLSLLKQCHLTKKIEIWVSKNKIHNMRVEDVEWMIFMEVSDPDLPKLVCSGSNSQPSYFIDNKKLVMCSCDETGRAWIYVVGDNKLISKNKIDLVVDPWPLHCTFFPGLVSVPRRHIEEAEVQV